MHKKKKKEKPHCIFKPQSLNMDISVSEIPFQLRIGIAVSGFYTVDFTSTGINHLCHDLIILIAGLLALSYGQIKIHLGFLVLLGNIFDCWLVGDSLDQMQLL